MLTASPIAMHGTSASSWRGLDHFFYDERFAAARRLARELARVIEPTPVQGDITYIWTAGLGRASLVAPMTMRGVTTESFYFCLKILLADQASVDANFERIDQDLYLWTIRSHNPEQHGTVSWQNHSRRV